MVIKRLMRMLRRKMSSLSSGGEPDSASLQSQKSEQYRGMASEINDFCGSLDGLRILEVGPGGADNNLSSYIAENFNVRKVVAIDPVANPLKKGNRLEIIRGDIRKTDFADDEFDLITSIAAFEHIPDLNLALEEMYRILRPGGLLYTKFGPIWSGPWGHHLWVRGNNSLYTYSNTALPSYCHLLMSEQEILAHCTEVMNIPTEDARLIARFACENSGQNRLFYSDYEQIVRDSPFQTLFFYGINKFPLTGSYAVGDYRKLLLDLNSRFPGKSGWNHNSIFMLLCKHEK
ncbi:class I SAM-dependent methyltransferase [Haliea sp. E17]|uniref:class I SAM-dependent methyltransferase n=1 Tax=Haliea sp. E17 TaxID=3401576 RepID=UPI003AAFDC7A